MKRYKQIKEGTVASIEFYVDKNNELQVFYNGKTSSFFNFIKVPEGQQIINIIYNKLMVQFKAFRPTQEKAKAQAIYDFIRKHFSLNQTPLDIFIKRDGKIIVNPDPDSRLM